MPHISRSTNLVFKNLYLLILRDLKIFFRDAAAYFLNSFIWILSTISLGAYFLPLLGMTRAFGTFILASSLATIALFEVKRFAILFVADFCGHNQVSYDLVLPINSSFVFVQRSFVVSIKSAFLCLFLIPISKLLFWNKIDLSNFCIWKFLLIFVVANIMLGFFGLFFAGLIRDIDRAKNMCRRIFFPLWFLGGYEFSWAMMHKVVPVLAFLSLANPVIYVMEGYRSTILGPSGSLNFWICISMIAIFSVVFYLRGICLLKRRLDCI
mgnify:CR=1 FL=1